MREPPGAERSEFRHVTLTANYAARAGAALQTHSLGEFKASSRGHHVFSYDCCKLIVDRKWGIVGMNFYSTACDVTEHMRGFSRNPAIISAMAQE